MSTYIQTSKHPTTGAWEQATWMDDFYGHHHYGVRFPDGSTFDPEEVKIETKE